MYAYLFSAYKCFVVIVDIICSTRIYIYIYIYIYIGYLYYIPWVWNNYSVPEPPLHQRANHPPVHPFFSSTVFFPLVHPSQHIVHPRYPSSSVSRRSESFRPPSSCASFRHRHRRRPCLARHSVLQRQRARLASSSATAHTPLACCPVSSPPARTPPARDPVASPLPRSSARLGSIPWPPLPTPQPPTSPAQPARIVPPTVHEPASSSSPSTSGSFNWTPLALVRLLQLDSIGPGQPSELDSMSHPEISNFRMWIERIIK
jgi:hypothetical protein